MARLSYIGSLIKININNLKTVKLKWTWEKITLKGISVGNERDQNEGKRIGKIWTELIGKNGQEK